MLDVMDDHNNHGTLHHRASSFHGITNFSMDEILRPDFGRKKITHSIEFLTSGLRVFSPLVLGSRSESSRYLRIPPLEKREDGITNSCRLRLSGSPGKSNQRHVFKPTVHRAPCKRDSSHFGTTEHPNKRTARDVPSPALNIQSASDCRTAPSPVTPLKDKVKTENEEKDDRMSWPAWVYCTRYSDRPSSGPRSRKIRRKEKTVEEKRPRTAFSSDQLQRLKREFEQNRYLNEQRRQELANELHLNESQIKIWFQNKRAKIKKCNSDKNGLALHLMAQGLYNHSTVIKSDDENDSRMDMSGDGDS